MNPQEAGQIATWLAIVTQLYNARMEQLLKKFNFTPTQFGVLVHLARSAGENQTISMLAAAHEVNQPGITKIVKKFEEMGLVESRRDSADSRKKYVSIAEAGFAKIGEVQQQIGPDIFSWFAEWDAAERQSFLRQLQTLGEWLDGNRLEN